MVPIDYRQLAPDTLDNLLSEFIMREGTDYGFQEIGFDSKKQQLIRKLEKGLVTIVYLPSEDYCDIIKSDQLV